MFFSINDTFKYAIASGDQVVFLYLKDDGKVATRFVTPLEFKGTDKVLCRQHLPKDDFRCFDLAKVQEAHRVIAKASF